ncbi:MAG: hypothetical protein N2109_02940 [Fimbriimonadales bacterium]|nr:hypothetical protein [Fimbriimonadales bacterium]
MKSEVPKPVIATVLALLLLAIGWIAWSQFKPTDSTKVRPDDYTMEPGEYRQKLIEQGKVSP